jgi:hypothetical protein
VAPHSGLYLDVIGDPRAANEIGKGFEDYVLRLCRAGLPDVEIQGAFDFGPKGRRRQTVDCLLHRQQRVEVLIECKAKRVPLAVKHELEETAARNAAIDELAKGMVQLCRTEEALRSGHVADWSIVDQPTLLLVTLDDWIFVGADIREEIEVAARPIAVARGLNPDALREIALCTATELDQLISTFEYSTIRLIARESRTQPYRHHQVSSVGRELFRGGRRTRPAYPLADELDSLIGLADLEGGRAPKVILGSSLG